MNVTSHFCYDLERSAVSHPMSRRGAKLRHEASSAESLTADKPLFWTDIALNLGYCTR